MCVYSITGMPLEAFPVLALLRCLSVVIFLLQQSVAMIISDSVAQKSPFTNPLISNQWILLHIDGLAQGYSNSIQGVSNGVTAVLHQAINMI